MIVLWIALFLIQVHSWSLEEEGLTTQAMKQRDEFDQIAELGDAQHRGDKWYDLESSRSQDSRSDAWSSESSISTSSISESISSDASSAETKEKRRSKQVHRQCTICPEDMLKSHKNVGIKWICGAYQRARRSFKSECMMRFRNCQDGTLFVKIFDHRCQNNTYHGRHWFYVYEV